MKSIKKRIKLNDSLLYFVKSNNKRHNIFGLWSLELLKTLEDDLINNNFRKVEDWANKIGVKTIDLETKKIDPFFNINTKEDFRRSRKNTKRKLMMINYKEAKKILIKSKIKINDEINKFIKINK